MNQRDDLAKLIRLYTEGQFNEVLQKLAQCKNFPRSLALLNISGSTYASLNQFDKAIHDYKEALKIEPKASDIQNNIGVLLAQKNDMNAINWYRIALENKPDFEAHKT